MTDHVREVPGILFGPSTNVRRRWLTLVKRAFKMGTWGTELSSLERIDLAGTTSRIVLNRTDPAPGRDNLILYPILDEISDAWASYMESEGQAARNRVYPLRRDLVLAAMDEFWFCLGTLGSSVWLGGSSAYEREQRQISRIGLRKLLRWWPDFIDLSSRFGASDYPKVTSWEGGPRTCWSAWCQIVGSLCHDMGVSEEMIRRMRRFDNAAEAGKRMQDWVEVGIDTADQGGAHG